MEGFEEGQKSLIRLHAVAGSVIISWIFPEALIGKLVQLARGNAAVFKNAGVEEVTVGGRRVYPVSHEVRDPVVIYDTVFRLLHVYPFCCRISQLSHMVCANTGLCPVVIVD